MSADLVHPSAVGTNIQPNTSPAPPNSDADSDHIDDPSLPPQRHAGAAGLGPNYPLGPSLTDRLGGLAEEIKGKTLGKAELVEHGRERRTGELMRKEREKDNSDNPFKGADGGRVRDVR